ncbi:PAS domain S-box protein [Phormidium sp. CCY1219]|uniref:PAS domain S-box protein n=1 Tax=Phormidium sp. CCY1219 TaxID=2886104 RepID=UPI002D1F9083|nr:PAS domain S-box protein [Phormidium sp. CCY1219]MEB3827633.1 PAS domain S-box protein [Phormidium sp. CCY1219]
MTSNSYFSEWSDPPEYREPQMSDNAQCGDRDRRDAPRRVSSSRATVVSPDRAQSNRDRTDIFCPAPYFNAELPDNIEGDYSESLRDSPHWRRLYFYLDLTACILAINPQGASILGYAAPELIGRNFLDLIYPEDRQRIQRKLKALTRQKACQWCPRDRGCLSPPFPLGEFRLQCHDKSKLWVSVTLSCAAGVGEKPGLFLAGELFARTQEGSEEATAGMHPQGTRTPAPVTQPLPAFPDISPEAIAAIEAKQLGCIAAADDPPAKHCENSVVPVFEQTLARTKSPVFITNPRLPDNPIVYVNPSFERLLGYSAAEAIGRNYRFLQSGDRETFAKITQCIAQGKKTRAIVRNARKDGTEFCCELSIYPVRNCAGELTHFIGIQNQTADVSASAAQLHPAAEQTTPPKPDSPPPKAPGGDSEQHYRRIVETTSDGLCTLDPGGNLSYVNPQLMKILQLSEAEMLGKPFLDFVDERSRAIASEAIAETRYGVSGRQDLQLRRPDGSSLWTLVSFQPLFDPGDRYAGTLATLCDISDRFRAEVSLTHQFQRERLIARTIARIRQSLHLDAILNTAVTEVREFLQCDRVLIFQFQPGWKSGTVLVESVADPWPKIVGTTIHDPCFENLVPLYLQGRIHAMSDLDAANLTPCYAALLSEFHVKANLVVPLVTPSRDPRTLNTMDSESSTMGLSNLWGLLVAHHCSSPRHWLSQETTLLQQLAAQLGIAISQSQLYRHLSQVGSTLELQVQERTAQLQQSLEFSDLVCRITDKVRESLDEAHILQTAVAELANVLKVDYCCAALYDADRTTATICYESSQSNMGSGLGQVIPIAQAPHVFDKLLAGEYFIAWDTGQMQYFQGPELGDLACPDLAQMVAAKLIVPIFDDRGAIAHLALLHSQSRVFGDPEIRLVQLVASQCAIALRQARLYQETLGKLDELETLNRLKDEFLSTVSHELRSPMTNMKMAIQMVQILCKQWETPDADPASIPSSSVRDRLSNYLRILHDQCEREINLINDLLDLQRLDAAYTREVSEIQLEHWLAELTARFEDRTNQRQQHLHLNLPTPLPPIVTETSSLERVMMELLNNACKYTPPEEEIIVSATVKGDRIRLCVTNTGIEIPPEEMNHVFEKFYRIPSGDPWKQGGTGLGLALVQKLTTHLGGQIFVESGDRKTSFIVEIPLTLN